MFGRVCLVACLLVGAVRADEPLPLALPAPDASIPGTTVSRPLQPVQVIETPVAPDAEKLPTEAQMARTEQVRPLGRSWQTFEYLLWWPKAHALPPLVTTSRGNTSPVLGGPNTLVLVGGVESDSANASGARFSVGYSVNDAQTAGLGVTYLFLGTQSESVLVSDAGIGRPRTIGRPITNALTRDQDVIPVSVPGVQSGSVEVATTTRLTGWEITGVANLYTSPQVRLNALAGYRYLMVNEGLRIEQTTLFPQNGANPPVLAGIADQFDAHNRFHGGQLGLVADVTHGPVFLEASGKVALGQGIAVVRTSGQTVAISPGVPVPAATFFQAGALGLPTNSGRFVQSGFAVLPEGMVKVGYRFRDRSRFFIGYNFLYLSDAIRPGDQIDTTVDPGQLPLFARGPQIALAPERPVPFLVRSDFWVQGLIFGLEYRY